MDGSVLEDFLIDDGGVDDLLLLLGFGSLGHCVTNYNGCMML